MNKFIFVLVNYNGAQITIECVKSIFRIKSTSIEKIVVVDNNSTITDREILANSKNSFSNKIQLEYLFLNSNIGYFGALNEGLKTISNKFDYYIVIGNNDLTFSHFFCSSIENISLKPSDFVISPNIINLNNIHQNPVEINSLSNFRKFLYRIFYINYFFYVGLTHLSRHFRKNRTIQDKNGWDTEQYVYLGFGACYILTPLFFKKNDNLMNLVFLYGEEAILSHQVHQTGGEILYSPNVVVNHLDHISFKTNISKKDDFVIAKKSYKIYKKYL